ncbi:MAG: cation-transporting P-type ATPase, partial [Candidatus Nanoarchaeia archaeon]|nr:cation-transporting P-type ATPase [Candidatus Nanoarchaeia archaeon]
MIKFNNINNVQTTKYWYLKSIDEILSELNSSKKGLTEAVAKEKIEIDGPNVIAQEEKGRMLKILFRNFNSILIYVLLMASLISLFADHVIEFIVILVIIFATGFSGFIQEYNAGKALDALSKLRVKYVYVLRDGVKKKIKSEDLVIGDLIFFERGMVVPADI